MTGTSVAALSGIAATASGGSLRQGAPENPDKPQQAADGTIGYAKGTYGNPVSPGTIRTVQKRFVSNYPGSGTKDQVILHDPTAEPAEQHQVDDKEEIVLGYGIAWEQGSPFIKIKSAPRTGTIPSSVRKTMERRAHDDISNFVAERKGGNR